MADIMKMVVGKRRINPIAKDSDRDGVIDILDCKPYDPRKQGLIHDIGAKLARKTGREELAERIEKRGEQIDKDRAEVREAQRESFQKERLIVARERGKRRARPGTSFKGFISGIARSSPIGLPRASPLKKGKKGKRPKTMRDVLGGNIPKFF